MLNFNTNNQLEHIFFSLIEQIKKHKIIVVVLLILRYVVPVILFLVVFSFIISAHFSMGRDAKIFMREVTSGIQEGTNKPRGYREYTNKELCENERTEENTVYKNGNFEKAIENYKRVIDSRIFSSEETKEISTRLEKAQAKLNGSK